MKPSAKCSYSCMPVLTQRREEKVWIRLTHAGSYVVLCENEDIKATQGRWKHFLQKICEAEKIVIVIFFSLKHMKVFVT